MPTRDLASADRHRLALGESAVEYLLVRRRGRRGVGLKVDEDGLTVSAPITMPLARIEALVRESERWVLRKVAEWSGRRPPEVSWTDGSRIPYRGGGLALRLAVAPGRSRAVRLGDALHVSIGNPDCEDVRRTVTAWYQQEARAYLGERVGMLSAAAGIAAPRLYISSATSRWGSCNSRGEVRLAWRLVKAPAELVDYVVCHELAHLRHMNHSAAFWAEVARQCPDYRALRARLFATDHLYRSF
jgi:predicted metal-dependent hydrolase